MQIFSVVSSLNTLSSLNTSRQLVLYFFSISGETRILTLILAIQSQSDELCHSILNEFWKSRQIEAKVNTINDYSKVKTSNTGAEKIEPNMLDPLLNEMTLMHSRYMLYTRFLKRRVQVNVNV